MPPCHQNCTIRNLLRLAKKELDNLNRVREDLDDLGFNEPGRLAEITAKLKAVAEIEDRKMAEARTLITYTDSDANSATLKLALSSNRAKNLRFQAMKTTNY